MEGESLTCSIQPSCSVGTQHGDGVQSLDDYNIAFDFAKKHGYGFVEFVDVTNAPRSRTRQKRKRIFSDADCMYSTSHYLGNERFSLKYKSHLNTIANQNRRNICSATDSMEIRNEMDIVNKLRDDIANLDINDAGTSKMKKRRQRSLSRKRKHFKRSQPKKLTVKCENRTKSNGIMKTYSQDKNEMIGGLSCSKRMFNDDEDGNDLSTTSDVTFNTWNEFGNRKISTVKNNNNYCPNSHEQALCNSDEGSSFGLQTPDNLFEMDEQIRDEIAHETKDSRQSFWKTIRKFNPFKSVISKLKIFKKSHRRNNTKEHPELPRFEEVQILRVDYNVTENECRINAHNTPCQSDRDGNEKIFSPNNSAAGHRHLKNTDKKICNSSKCRPKQASLKNNSVKQVFEMCGNKRRFFSCTNLTRDQKDRKWTSLDKYGDTTSGDFAKIFSDEFCKKSQMLTSKSTANAHGDVVLTKNTKDDIVESPYVPGDHILACEHERIGSVYECNNAQEVSNILTHMNREGLTLQESGKNNNQCDTTTVVKGNYVDESRMLGMKTLYRGETKHAIGAETDYKKRHSGGCLSCLRKEHDTETLTGSNQALKDEKDQYNISVYAVPGDSKQNLSSDESNRNNNAQDKGNGLEPDLNESQTSLISNVGTSPILQYSRPRTTLRSDVCPNNNNDNIELRLDNELKCLVDDQDKNDENHSPCAYRGSDLLCTNANDSYSDKNSSKTIQRDHQRSTGRYCIPSSSNPNRSYVLSSPRRRDSDVSESFTAQRSTNNTDRQDNNIALDELCADHDESLDYENMRDDAECHEPGFPPINSHQKNMVYCPTTENYWAQTSYPGLMNADTVQNNSHRGQISSESCVDPMNEEITCAVPQNRDADTTMEFYRLIDSCIAESENKLRQRLENLYKSVNERLCSLESLVKKKFDKTLSLIGNLKKHNRDKCMNNVDEKNGRISRSIHLNTEATRSNVPENYSVKNLGNLTKVGCESTSNGHNTFPSIAFTEVTPNNNHIHSAPSPEKSDSKAGSVSPTHRESDTEATERKYYVRKPNRVKDHSKRNRRKYRSRQRHLVKKRKRFKYQQRGGKKRKTRYSTKLKKRNTIRGSVHSKMMGNDGTKFAPLPYLQKQHSRKCRLRHRLTNGGNCSLCMISKGGEGKGHSSKKVVKWWGNEAATGGKRKQYRRSPHARIVKSSQRTKTRHRSTDKKRRKRTKENKRVNKGRKRKANRSKRHLNKSNSSVQQSFVDGLCNNVVDDTLSKHFTAAPQSSQRKCDIPKQNHASHNNKKSVQGQTNIFKPKKEQSKLSGKLDKKLPLRKFGKATQKHDSLDSHVAKGTGVTKSGHEVDCCASCHRGHVCGKPKHRISMFKSRQRRGKSKVKKTKGQKIVTWLSDDTRKRATSLRHRQLHHPKAGSILQCVKQIKISQGKRQTNPPKVKRSKRSTDGKKRKIGKSNRKANLNVFEYLSNKGGERNIATGKHGRGYKQIVKENRSLLKEIADMKRCLSHGCKEAIVKKREVFDEFNKLLTECSHERAHNLHKILFSRKNIHKPSCTDAHSSMTSNSRQNGNQLFGCNEENNNKSLVSYDNDNLKRTQHQQNINRLPGTQTFVRNGILRHVDSLSLIRKGRSCKNNSKNPCMTLNPSFRQTQAHRSISAEASCSSTAVVGCGNVLPRLLQRRRNSEKRNKSKETRVCFMENNFSGLDSYGSASGKNRVVKWRDDIVNDTTEIRDKPITGEGTDTNSVNALVNDSDLDMLSPITNSSAGSCHQYSGLLRLLCHGNLKTDKSATYSWSKPICVDTSDISRPEGIEFPRPLHGEARGKEGSSHFDERKGRIGKEFETAKNTMEQEGKTKSSVAFRTETIKNKDGNSSFESVATMHTGSESANGAGRDEPSPSVTSHAWHMKHPTLVLRLRPNDSFDVVSGLGQREHENKQHVLKNQGPDIANFLNASDNMSSVIENNGIEKNTNLELDSKLDSGNQKVKDDRADAISKDPNVVGVDGNPPMQRELENETTLASLDGSSNQSSIPSEPVSSSRCALTCQQEVCSDSVSDCRHQSSLLSEQNNNTHFRNMENNDMVESIRMSQNSQIDEGQLTSTSHDDVSGKSHNNHATREYAVFSCKDNAMPADNKTDTEGSLVEDSCKARLLSHDSEIFRSQGTECSSPNSFGNSVTMSTNNNKIISESSSITLNTESADDNCGPIKQGGLLSAVKKEPIKDSLFSQDSNSRNETDHSGADDEMSSTEYKASRQSYLEVRTPGVSTRWTVFTTPPTTMLGHQNNNQSSDFDNKNALSRDSAPTNRQPGCNQVNEAIVIDLTESNGSIVEGNVCSQCQEHTGQLENDYPGFSSDPEEPSSTSSGTNNNNVTDNIVSFQRQRDGTPTLRRNNKKLKSFTNCRYLPYNRYNCRCCCVPVKSMTTLHSEKRKLLQSMCLLGLSDAQEGCSHGILPTNQDGMSWKDSPKPEGVALNPRKRPISTEMDEDKNTYSAKCRRKEGLSSSSAKRSKTHFRRARWQLMREIRLSKLSKGCRKHRHTNSIIKTPPKPVQSPSSDADSESSL